MPSSNRSIPFKAIVYGITLFSMIALAIVPVAAQDQKPLVSKASFAQEVIAIQTQLQSNCVFYYKEDTDTVLAKSCTGDVADDFSGNQFTYLGNIYNAAKYMPRSERKKYVENFLATAEQDDPKSRDEFLASLMLRVRTPAENSIKRMYLESQFGEKFTFVTQRKGPLLLELVSDSEIALSTTSLEDLEKNTISKTKAFKVAHSNMLKRVTTDKWEKAGKNIWASMVLDDYDSGRFVASPQRFTLPFKTAPIIYMPSHSDFLFTNKSDPKTLERMIKEGNDRSKDKRPFSEKIWTVKNGEVIQWSPSPDHKSYNIAMRQQAIELHALYSEQRVTLGQAAEKRNVTVEITKFAAFALENGSIRSRTWYTLDTSSVVPKADFVSIYSNEISADDGYIGDISWEQFSSTIGGVDQRRYQDLEPILYGFKKPFSKVINETLIELAQASDQ